MSIFWRRVLIGILSVALVVPILQLLPQAIADATPSLVQSAIKSQDSASTTITQAFTSNNTAANTIVAAVTWDSTTSITCSDSRSNAYTTVLTKRDTVNNQSLAVCYATNIAAGSNTVTVTFSGASAFRRLAIHEYSGLATAAAVDTSASNVAQATTASNNVTSGSSTTAFNGDLIFGAVIDTDSNTSISAGTGFTQRTSINNKDLATQDQTQTVANTIASTQTFGATHRYAAIMVAFKPAGSPAPTTPTFVQAPAGAAAISAATTISSTFTAPNTTGNTIVAAVGWDGAGSVTCSDTKNNSYTTVITKRDTVNNQSAAICYASNITAGTNTVKASFGASRNYRYLLIQEYSGILSSSPIDGSASNVAVATTATDNVTSTAITTTTPGDLIFGIANDTNTDIIITPGAGFSQRASTNSTDYITQDKIQSAPGSVSSTATFGSTDRYVAAVVAFKPASAAPTTPAHVQSPAAVATGSASAPTVSSTFSSNNAAGNAIVAAISWDGNSTPSCSDQRSNNYTLAVTKYDSVNQQSIGICYATNIVAGPNTVTISWANSVSWRYLIINEYSGIASLGAADGSASNTAVPTTATDNVTSGSTTTTGNGDLIYGAVIDTDSATSINAGTGFTQRNYANNKDFAVEDKVQATAAPIAATHTFGAADRYLSAMVALRPATTTPTSPPAASFTATPTSGTAPLNVSFNAGASSASGGATITGYSWTFGDGGTASGVTASHNYPTAGDFTATLTVTDSNSQTGTATQTIHAHSTPTASLTASPTSGAAPLAVNFNASGSSTTGGATITNYSWNFGDGNTATGATTSHTFTTATDFTVTLTITDSNAQTAATTQTIHAYTSPTATFTATPTSGTVPMPVSLNASGSTGNGGATITGYSWNFGDSTTGTGVNPSHTYTTRGDYTVTLTVTDSHAQTATTTQVIHAYNAPTPAIVPTTTNGLSPLEVNVDGTTSSADTGTITNYSWNFGDSATATGGTQQHSYASAGTYTITLTVTDSHGGTATATQNVTVYNAPTAAYTYTPRSGNAPLVVAFDASLSSAPSPATITTYSWNFGDGSASAFGISPSHTYNNPGTYSATLTITDSHNNQAVATHVINVASGPVAHETQTSTSGNDPLTVNFDGSTSTTPSPATITNYAWNFGDGYNGTGVTTSHTYGPGSFTATLTVTDSQNRTATTTQSIAVNSSNYSQAVLGDGPVRYYRLSETSGTTATDSSPSHVDGAYSAVAQLGSGGAINGDSDTSVSSQAISGTTVMSAPATSLPSGNAARTIEGWFKSTGRYYTVVGYSDFYISDEQFGQLTLHSNGGGFSANPEYGIEDGNWHYVAATYDGTTARMYVDGVMTGFKPLTINTSISSQIVNTSVGGSADELAIYPTALSASQISNHWTKANQSTGGSCAAAPSGSYATAVKGDNPIAYYRLGENNSSSRAILDSSGHCLNGERAPATTSTSGALAGDGNTALTSPGPGLMAASATNLPAGNSPRTIEGWFKSTGRYYTAVGYSDFTITDEQFGQLTLHTGAGDISGGQPYGIEDGTWHYAAATFDGTTATLYLDGQPIGRNTFSLTTITDGRSLMSDANNTDEVAAYGRALTDAQIAAHWTKGASTQGVCAATPTSQYSTVIRADHPDAYYRVGDSNISRVAYDASGNCHNGTYSPTATNDPNAAIQGEANGSIAGGGDGFGVGASTLPSGNAQRTIEVWFKLNARYHSPVGYGDFFFTDEQFGYMTLHAGSASFGVNGIEDGNWHLIEGTYDGSVAKLYLDGNYVDQRVVSGGLNTSTAGQLSTNGGGSIDEMAVYDHVLPDDHIKLHYFAGKYAGLVGSAINLRELMANGNFCYACAAQALMSAAHALHVDPVDTTFGTLSESVNDLSISGRGEPLMAMRSYSSGMSTDNGPFGYGWKGGYNAHLSVDGTSGNVTVSQENGAEVTFINNAGTYTPSAPRFIASLVHNGDGTWTMVRNHVETLTFNAIGQITSQADRNGITTTISYDGSGNLQTVTSTEGRSLTFTWTGAHITGVSDSSGRSVAYTYDGNGNLSSVTAADGGVTHYTYDASHHLLTMLDPNQNGSSSPVPVTNVYDSSGRVTSQTDQLNRTTTFTYNADGSVLVTDPVGNQSLDIYQNNLRVAVVKGYGTPQATTTHFGYDPTTGALAATFTEAPNDANDHATFATYDADGHMLTSADGMGRVSSYTYDSLGDVLTATMPNPSATGPVTVTATNTYDINGNLLTTTKPLYTSATAHTDQTVTYTRSVGGKPDLVSATTDPAGKTTSMGYDSIGQLTSITSPEGRITTYGHDNLGRVTTVTSPRGNVSGATAANFTTTTSYDALNRVLSTSTANSGVPIVSTNVYDHNGNLTSSTDGDNRTTTYSYDLANEQTVVHRPDTTTLQTTYYGNGVVHQQIDGAGQATTYGQDSLGRLISSEDPLHRITSYTYDGAGKAIRSTDPSNRVTTNAYDNAGELISTSYSDGTTPNVTVAYNQSGARSGMTDGSGNQSWIYDSLGRLTAQTNGANKTVGYEYDIRGELTSINYPGNGNVTRTYGDDGELNSVTDFNSNQTTFAYDQDLRLQTTNYANGVVGTNSYDNAGQMNNITYAKGSTSLVSYGYGRTTGGDINAETDSGSSAGANKTYTYNTLGQLATENSSTFGYDTADNLTSINGTSQTYDVANEVQTHGSTSYGYDAQGNRTSATTGSVTTQATFDQANRMKSFGMSAYSYDGGGLRTLKTVGSVASSFVYDVAEGLPLIVDDGTNEYIYGPQGPIEQINGSTTSYLHVDQLGSTRLISDSSGNASGSYQFDAYGNTTTHTGIDTPLQYVGQYKDGESGLYWMRARYYDSNSGQFVSRDPLVADTRYAYGYAGNDPSNSADPSGLKGPNWFERGAMSVNSTFNDNFIRGSIAVNSYVSCINNPLNRNDGCVSLADESHDVHTFRNAATVVAAGALVVAGGAAIAGVAGAAAGAEAAGEEGCAGFSRASQFVKWAEDQGWQPKQTENGPIKYQDENGVNRVTIKRGSGRAPGSENPHVELRDPTGQRIDPNGNPVTRKSPGNHTPIQYDLK